MVKKKPGKLTLHKETLKALDTASLQNVNGGTLTCSVDNCPISWLEGCEIDSNPC